MRATKIFVFLAVLALLPVLGRAAGAQGPDRQDEVSLQSTLGTGFTYQGRLTDAGSPATGVYDFEFRLYSASSSGSQVGPTVTHDEVPMTDGLFTVELDFGNGVFTGDARYLAIAVRPGDSSGAFTALTPRQAITPAPYALHAINAWSLTGTRGTDPATHYLGTSDNHPLIFKTNGTEAMRIDAAGDLGIGTADPRAKVEVNAGTSGDGVIVQSAGDDGVDVRSPNDDGLRVVDVGDDGVYVESAGHDGVRVESADNDGVSIISAVDDGMYVESAGGRGVYVESAGADGVFVNNAATDGVTVDSAGQVGLAVRSAALDGVFVGSAGNPSTVFTTSDRNGVEVSGAEHHGLFVGRADENGVYIESTGDDGVRVNAVGSPDFVACLGALNNGFEVCGAEGNGFHVGRADTFGVYVESAGSDGVWINSATYNGIVVQTAGSYAGVFNGNVQITGTCSGCTLAAFGRNAGHTALEAGDVVAVHGITHTDLQNAPVVMEVGRATGREAVIGVIAGRAEVVNEGANIDAQIAPRLVPRDKPAPSGEYVSIIIAGLARVKASALAAPIQAGTRLTAADEAGHARAVKTVETQGVQIAEDAALLGMALESLEGGQELIWVLVNPG
jgi:hypothetical protein